MLKISMLDTRRQRQLLIEGKLVGPWVAEMRNACDRARSGAGGRELLIDFRNLTAISQEGENVLLQLMKEGVKFRCSGVFAKHVISQLNRRARRN
jgi:anti-anti-sigma regulatory factor